MKTQEQLATVAEMEKQASIVSTLRDELRDKTTELKKRQQELKDELYPSIRTTLRTLIKAQEGLMAFIQDNTSLFIKRKSRITDSIKYGLRKKTGKTVWNDDDQLMTNIRALIKKGEIAPELESQLIKQVEKPVAEAVAKLDGKTLKKLGVTIKSDTDTVFIANTDTALNKTLDALIKDASVEELEDLEGVI